MFEKVGDQMIDWRSIGNTDTYMSESQESRLLKEEADSWDYFVHNLVSRLQFFAITLQDVSVNESHCF